MQRPSLLDNDEFASIGAAGNESRAPIERMTIAKLSIAAGLFVAAGALFCAQLGVFERPDPIVEVSATVHDARLEQSRQDQEELDRMIKSGEIRIDGS